MKDIFFFLEKYLKKIFLVQKFFKGSNNKQDCNRYFAGDKLKNVFRLTEGIHHHYR